MKKEFWTVDVYLPATCLPTLAWFDNLEDAKKFATCKQTGRIVKHTYTIKHDIEEAERACKITREWMV